MSEIFGGVIGNNRIYWLSDIMLDSIDLNYELWKKENPDIEDDYFDSGGGEMLVGFKKLDKPDDEGYTYVPDPDATYSAIISELVTQVTVSIYAKSCHSCSPCFPNQGDLESKITCKHLFAYALPPEDLIEDFDELCKGTGTEISEILEDNSALQGIFCILSEDESALKDAISALPDEIDTLSVLINGVPYA